MNTYQPIVTKIAATQVPADLTQTVQVTDFVGDVMASGATSVDITPTGIRVKFGQGRAHVYKAGNWLVFTDGNPPRQMTDGAFSDAYELAD